MQGGGRRYPDQLREFVVGDKQAIRKKSVIRAVHESTVELARERAKEVKELQARNKVLQQEKEAVETRLATRVESEVRMHVRQARRDLNTGIYFELAGLKEALVQARRVAARRRYVETSAAKRSKQADLIAGLRRSLDTEKKKVQMLERRVRELSEVNVKREAAVSSLCAEVKRFKSEALISKREAATATDEAKRAHDVAKRAQDEHAREVTKSTEKAAQVEKMEKDADEAMADMAAKQNELEEEHESALASADERIAALVAMLRDEQGPRPIDRSEEAFEALSASGKRSARMREVQYAEWFVSQREWRVADWISVVQRQGWLEEFWESKAVWELRMEWMREVLAICTSQHWGVKLGLYLTLTEHLPTRQILRIRQASSKDYDADTNTYNRRPLVTNPHLAPTSQEATIYVPPIMPAINQFAAELKEFTQENGLAMSANGRVAVQDLKTLVAQIAHESARLKQLPIASAFPSRCKLAVVIQLDAARRRTRQFVACVVKNPQLNSQSCFALRLLALGVRFKDDRHGAQQLLASNMDYIEELLNTGETLVHSVEGVRAIEGSVCGCPPDAMHAVPSASEVATLHDLIASLRVCDCTSTHLQRTARAHHPQRDGQLLPCDCCTFARDPSDSQAELRTFEQRLADLRAASTTEQGKKDLSAFVSAHKRKHKGTPPGADGTPFTSASLLDWIVDLLHVDLNEGKLTWKWALVRQLPQDVRTRISDYLKDIGLPLDLRTKDEGRVAMEKFYEGSDWHRFCCGGGHSPGGPVIIARIVMMVADYYEQLLAESERKAAAASPNHRAQVEAERAPARASSSRPSKRRRGGVVTFAEEDDATVMTADSGTAEADGLPWHEAFLQAKEVQRSEAERKADPSSLRVIRERYGDMSERLIGMLLTFDALFNFRKVMRRRFDKSVREERALLFAQTHRVFWEQLERITLGRHKSQYPHTVQFKAVQQMLDVGDLWNFSLSALESYHAEVGRVADRTGCKRINSDADGGVTLSTRPAGKGKQGPARLVETAVKTTMASSVPARLVGARALNMSDEYRIDMRAQTRIALAPEEGGGRSTAQRSAVRLSAIIVDPTTTCMIEFAKLVAAPTPASC